MSHADDTLAAIREFARSYSRRKDLAHDATHIERVARLAERIRSEEGGDRFLVEAGAWLHQLHDELDELQRFLSALPLAERLRDRLFRIVRDCRPEQIAASSSLEAQIVFDADALEVLGPYGAVRELLCNACVRGKDWPVSVADTREMQRRFASRLRTTTARRLAAGANRIAERFWSSYDRWQELRLRVGARPARAGERES